MYQLLFLLNGQCLDTIKLVCLQDISPKILTLRRSELCSKGFPAKGFVPRLSCTCHSPAKSRALQSPVNACTVSYMHPEHTLFLETSVPGIHKPYAFFESAFCQWIFSFRFVFSLLNNRLSLLWVGSVFFVPLNSYLFQFWIMRIWVYFISFLIYML